MTMILASSDAWPAAFIIVAILIYFGFLVWWTGR